MIGFYNYTVIVTYLGFIFALCGVMICQQNPGLGILFLVLSGFCDMFDGAIARTRKRTDEEKRFGIQIDSLADLTSFGVLPACIGYAVGLNQPWQMLILFGYALAALIRLAYFNVMEEIRQDKEGGKRRSAEVVADNVYFGESKRSNDGGSYNGGNSYGGNNYGGNTYSAPAAPSYGSYAAPAGNPASDFAMLDDDDAQLPF